jgi:hypothetical protein
LATEVRRELLESLVDDIALLEELTDWALDDWTGDRGRGAYLDRRVTA